MLPGTYGGALEVFAVGKDGNLGHMWQNSPNGDWSSWAEFPPSSFLNEILKVGIQLDGAPTVFQNSGGRLEVFGVTRDGRLGHVYQGVPNEGWSAWADLGPAPLITPVVFQTTSGELMLFAIGRDGHLIQMHQTVPNPLGASRAWSPWYQIGPVIKSTPAVYLNSEGGLEIFAVGPDGLLGNMRQRGPTAEWLAWTAIGPAIKGAPVVSEDVRGRLEVFALGPDGLLGHTSRPQPEGSWSAWSPLGPAITSAPAVFQNTDGTIELFAAAADGKLGHIRQMAATGAWSAWNEIGPVITSAPAIFANADGHLEVFAADQNGNLGHMWQTSVGSSTWTSWNDFGVPIQSNPAVFQNASPDTLGSNINYTFIASDLKGGPLTGVVLTIDVFEDIIGDDGWGFQLNGQSPAASTTVGWQQFIVFDFPKKLEPDGSRTFKGVMACANTWPPDINNQNALITAIPTLFTPPSNTLPAGSKIVIELLNDASSNITGATYTISDASGVVKGQTTIDLLKVSGQSIPQKDLAPIVALQFVLVGPFDGASTTLSSGKGKFNITASSNLVAFEPDALPAGVPGVLQTAESANSIYGPWITLGNGDFDQDFSATV